MFAHTRADEMPHSSHNGDLSMTFVSVALAGACAMNCIDLRTPNRVHRAKDYHFRSEQWFFFFFVAFVWREAISTPCVLVMG